jgi:RHS repeat-associated protein
VYLESHPRPYTLSREGLFHFPILPPAFSSQRLDLLTFRPLDSVPPLNDHRPLTAPHYRFKSFSCNTYGSAHKCCKQKTYAPAKLFRCNTYKKHGGGGAAQTSRAQRFGGQNSFNFANNRITTSNFSYDNSGNVTANGPATNFTYNPEDFMTAATTTLGAPAYTVDTQGRRTKKTVSGTTTDYFYSGALVISEKQGTTWTDYVFFGSQRIAKQTGSTATTATYLHPDHLGSTRRCSDSSGNSNGACDYEPFGEAQPGSTCSNLPTNYRFAGMELDPETGLYHTVFRQYDSNQGRWMSVDSLPGSSDNPQSQLRYSLVLNDPVNHVDPLGLCFVDAMLWTYQRVWFGADGWGPWQLVNVEALQVEVGSCGGPERLGAGGGGGGGNGNRGGGAGPASALVKKVLTGNNDCSTFFNNSQLVQGFKNSPAAALLPTTAASFFASDYIEPKKEFPNNQGAGANEGAGSNTVIAYNANSSSVFNSAFNPQTGKAYPSSQLGGFNGGSVQAQALMLLHELGHTLLLIPPDGPGAAAMGFPSSQTNTQTIADNCAKSIQAALNAQ